MILNGYQDRVFTVELVQSVFLFAEFYGVANKIAHNLFKTNGIKKHFMIFWRFAPQWRHCFEAISKTSILSDDLFSTSSSTMKIPFYRTEFC